MAEETKKEVAVAKQSEAAVDVKAGFKSLAGFELLQRMTMMFNQSTLVPDHFRGPQNFGNCAIALNMAQRLNADPLMTMQNLYVVHGNPGWSAKFLIAMFNQCGKYTSIKYRETGAKGTDTQGIIAYTTEKLTGETIEGPEVTIAIAKKEGWYGKNGSKWQTMPDQMLRYRAASWLIRTTAPELSMGLQTEDEIIDVTPEKNITEDAIKAAQRDVEESANKEAVEDMPPTKPETPKAATKATVKREIKVKGETAADGPGF